ncbi:MAG: bifunctional nicotinamidase/pyrazinamidase [Candidatus Omnitrophica bacterium]|nr:bifunctional nicotinamidase/pyrazinamidase [Candidatus Omnitrophota bacterium]
MMITIDRFSSLIIVDAQNDFCPGGALAVKNGDKVVSVLNRYIAYFQAVRAPIFATRDWHPKNHVSFKERGGPWPPHCVQGSKGANLHPELKLPYASTVISKGFLPDQDAYSGFQGTDLEVRLKEKGVKRVFIGGLATDYCVKNTVLDALKCGFEIFLLTDAIHGVEVKKGDSKKAIDDMVGAGAKEITIKNLKFVKLART